MADVFEDSRRLTGGNVYFAGSGAALEAAAGPAADAATLARWAGNIAAARAALGWPVGPVLVRPHASGASLAFEAPFDQLYAATEVNEWAWSAAVASTSGESHAAYLAPGHASRRDAGSALHTLRAVAAAEANPPLVALRAAAHARGLPFFSDDDEATAGAGRGAATWPVQALPAPEAIDWATLHDIPSALVTGSNGKTTTVRLVAAMTRAHGWPTAHSCTDGVFFDGVELESGDYSGPTGARTALRQPRAEAAVLETARGGLLRRGLAVERVRAAVVTNVSEDHFGEYGVHGLAELARVKLTVARAVADDGLLVLNADDALLRELGADSSRPLGWFALDAEAPWMVAHRARGGATCGVHAGRLQLHWRGRDHDLGAVADMPLALGGRATYNVANIAAASLAASAMGVPPATIASALARFGAGSGDNPGRLQHWRFDTLDVFVDYAHNPEGLHGFLRAIGADRRTGRLAMILGHAGNREDADLRAVAATAAAYRPELVVLKDIGGYERGRTAGEVAGIMRATLIASGVGTDAIETRLDEVEAARRPLEWARAGDLLALPVHELSARARVVHLLDALHAQGWRAGQPLPPTEDDMP